jgi:virginiamycin B lyase
MARHRPPVALLACAALIAASLGLGLLSSATPGHATLVKAERSCVVPNVKERSLRAAKNMLRRRGCGVGAVRRSFSSTVPRGHVISQRPHPGARHPAGAKVRLVLSKGRRPGSTGPTVDAAIAAPGTGQVATGGGAVWATNGDGSVSRIDPNTNKVVAVLQVGPQNLEFAVITDTDVWISAPDADALYRISIATNAISGPIALPSGSSPKGGAIAAGSVWVALEHAGAVARIDPATNDVLATIAVGSVGSNGPLAVAESSGDVWVSVPADGKVVRVDPGTNGVMAKAPMTQECEFASTGTDLWVGGGCGGTQLATVDQSTSKTSRLADLAPDVVGGPVVIGQTLWLITFNADLARIDTGSGAVSRSTPFKGYNVDGESLAAGFGDLWVRAAGHVLRLKT